VSPDMSFDSSLSDSLGRRDATSPIPAYEFTLSSAGRGGVHSGGLSGRRSSPMIAPGRNRRSPERTLGPTRFKAIDLR
jgi:hypothetical protein